MGDVAIITEPEDENQQNYLKNIRVLNFVASIQQTNATKGRLFRF